MKTLLRAKYLLAVLLTLVLSLCLLPSCSDDDEPIIWDVSPMCIYIRINNAQGDNLLLPDTPGTLYEKQITADYEGKEYPLEWTLNPRSRYYMPHFSGLTLRCGYKETETGFELDTTNTFLQFGEFDGEITQDVNLTLKIEGYPQTWEITAKHEFKWKKKEPHIKTTYYLNGQEVKNRAITITL